MSGLETIAHGMQLVFQAMFFVLGAVIYGVVVCSLVDAESRGKWLVPIPLAFGLAILLVLPYLLGWVGWVLYFALIAGWAAVVLWLNPALREAVWEALIWLWEAMPHRVAARKAQEEAERQAAEAEKLRRQREKEDEERRWAERKREIDEARERERQQEAERQAEREASGEAERERQAAAQRWERLKAEAAEEKKRKAEELEAKQRADAERQAAEAKQKADADAKAKAEAEAKATQPAVDEDGYPMF